MRKFSTDEPLRCSFCHKTQEQVEKLISSPPEFRGAYICNGCVEVCHQILEDEKREQGAVKPRRPLARILVDLVTGRAFGPARGNKDPKMIGAPSLKEY